MGKMVECTLLSHFTNHDWTRSKKTPVIVNDALSKAKLHFLGPHSASLPISSHWELTEVAAAILHKSHQLYPMSDTSYLFWFPLKLPLYTPMSRSSSVFSGSMANIFKETYMSPQKILPISRFGEQFSLLQLRASCR